MATKGIKFTKEHKIKIGLANKGKKRSLEMNQRSSVAHKGYIMSKKTKQKMSKSAKGKHFVFLGKNLSVEHRKKISLALQGDKSHFWKGGYTKKNLIIRNSIEYKLWREAVYKRDNYTCQECGYNKSGSLNAHHIKQFALFPELRFAIDNGITLCVKCHQKTDTFGWNILNKILVVIEK